MRRITRPRYGRGASGSRFVPPNAEVAVSALPGERYILHVDADAFFASVEQVLRPDLQGLPVIVSGGDRGVVSAASYEARRFGVHSAMPTVQARKLCPRAVFLSPNFSAYKEFSTRMFAIMKGYSPQVEVTSVDEGYVDLTGTFRLHRAPPWEIAHRMLSEIRAGLGINVSGGIAGTKCFAKMTTGLAKPNGLLYLEPQHARIVLARLPVESIPGVGKKAEEILKRRGIMTVGDVADLSRRRLQRLLGKWGGALWELATGNDGRPVVSSHRDPQKSYSKEHTLEQDSKDLGHVWSVVAQLTEKVAARLRADGRGACTVTVKVRSADFSDMSRSMSLKFPTNLTRDLLDCAARLFRLTAGRRFGIRQVGVKLSGIDVPVLQTDLFEPRRHIAAARDRTVDQIRNRFGFHAVKILRGSGYGQPPGVG
ncbi:MAG: DNA polymerase IV [Desulfomonile tiedjei]|nr:DNA polymerase IV [Desulfomonile tiedjei]